jgi:hypothetical protein
MKQNTLNVTAPLICSINTVLYSDELARHRREMAALTEGLILVPKVIYTKAVHLCGRPNNSSFGCRVDAGHVAGTFLHLRP